MRFKNQELLTSAILYLFPWTGSLFGGWALVEAFIPPHQYEALAAALTILWAYAAYPFYCRLAARNGFDPVRIVALYACLGILGVMIASVWACSHLPLLSDVLAVLPPFLTLILCTILGGLCWFAPVALFVNRRTASRKD